MNMGIESAQDLSVYNQQIIIQMGNTLQTQHQDQRHSLTPTSADPRYDYLSQWKNSNGDHLLARQIELPQSACLHNLKNRLQNRQNLLPDISCIYPLNQCYFQHMASMCSQQERCMLTCLKPKNNLEKVLEERRLSGMAFTSEEINLILKNVSQALKTLLELNECFCSLRMSHIAIDDNVYLMDPILIESDPFGYGSLGEYPAPEQLRQEEQILSKESLMHLHLFSLGVIGLQLYHSSSYVKDIYERYHKYGSIISINMQRLNQHIMNVSDPFLRAKLATLTSFNSETRKNIYKFIQKQNMSSQHVQIIARQLEVCKPIHHIPPMSPLIKNITPIREKPVLKELKNNQNQSISPIIKHQHLQKGQTPIASENIVYQKPKVSINFISKIHHSNAYSNQMAMNTRSTMTTSNNSKKQNMHSPQNKNYLNIAEQTPLRMKKKRNFSTIKEVSEYDECTSTSRVNTFQDVTVNGRYEGQMQSGKRQGRGTFYFQQGSIYDGQWKDDQMHGYGKLYYPSGKLAYQGQWKHNQFSGTGKVFNDEPHRLDHPFDFTDFNQLGEEWIFYEGNLEQDQRQGKGRLVLSNGQSIKGQFYCDRVHGVGQFQTLSGKVIQGIWNESILQRTFGQ